MATYQCFVFTLALGFLSSGCAQPSDLDVAAAKATDKVPSVDEKKSLAITPPLKPAKKDPTTAEIRELLVNIVNVESRLDSAETTITENTETQPSIPGYRELTTAEDQLRQAMKGVEPVVNSCLLDLAFDSVVGDTAKLWITNAETQYELAARFEHGHGVEKSLKSAIAWYQKSAGQGYEQAEQRTKHFEGMQAAVVEKLSAQERFKNATIPLDSEAGQAIQKGVVMLNWLEKQKQRYSTRSTRSVYRGGFGGGLGGFGGFGGGSFGPARQAHDAGNYAARMHVQRDMEELSAKLELIKENYFEQLRQQVPQLTPEEQGFALAIGILQQ